jgi:hypothetical protein
MKIGVLGVQPESVLGTVDRFYLSSLFADTYKIDHLSKKQVVASDSSTSIGPADFPCGIFSCNFDYNRGTGPEGQSATGCVPRSSTRTHRGCAPVIVAGRRATYESRESPLTSLGKFLKGRQPQGC